MLLSVQFGADAAALPAGKGQTLLAVAIRHGVPLPHVCGGQANCTTCRVRVRTGRASLSRAQDKELHRLPDALLAEGWRLACQTRLLAPGRIELELP